MGNRLFVIVISLLLLSRSAGIPLKLLDSSCASHLSWCPPATSETSDLDSQAQVLLVRVVRAWFNQPILRPNTTLTKGIISSPISSSLYCDSIDDSHENYWESDFPFETNSKFDGNPAVRAAMTSASLAAYRRATSNEAGFVVALKIDPSELQRKPVTSECSVDFGVQSFSNEMYPPFQIECSLSSVPIIRLPLKTCQMAESWTEKQNTRGTNSHSIPLNGGPPLQIHSHNIPEFLTKLEVRWLPKFEAGSLLESGVQDISDDPDGSEDPDETLYAKQTINIWENYCLLYYITSDPTCPVIPTDPFTAALVLLMNLMIKCIVGEMIHPLLQLTTPTFNDGGQLPVDIADTILLETGTVENEPRPSGSGDNLVHAAVGGVFRSLFSPWADLRQNTENILNEEMRHVLKRLLKEKQSKMDKETITPSYQKQKTEEEASFLEVEVEGPIWGDEPMKPLEPDFNHIGKLLLPAATEAIVVACKDAVADAMKEALMPGGDPMGRLAKLVVREVHDRVHYPTLLRTTDSVVHGLTHTLPQTLAQTVAKAVNEIVVAEGSTRLLDRLTIGLTNTLTRSLTHTLSSSIIASIGGSPEALSACYDCHHRGARCRECVRLSGGHHGGTGMVGPGTMQQVNYYASYYSDYYSAQLALEEEGSVREAMLKHA